MKTSNEELNKWRFDHRRGPVSLRIVGDEAYAQAFIGEAKALLFSVKNALQLNQQPQGEGQRNFSDGTRIRVKCVFGQDIIEIDTSRATFGPMLAESCTITFISLPTVVPPMKNPYEVKPGEKQGIDYFKTYYKVILKNCPECKDVSWDLTFKYDKPPESRHWIDPGDPNKEDKNDHTIYSMDPPAWARIVEKGKDGAGTYIIWKAFTESGDISRTGLGVMLIKATIDSLKKLELCKQEMKVLVDCCKKVPDQRKVEIWWEDDIFGGGFMWGGGIKLYKMPTSINASIFYEYSSPYNRGILYAIGGCIPFEWTLTGFPDPFNTIGEYKIEAGYEAKWWWEEAGEGICTQKGTLTLVDRCETQYNVDITSCCDTAKPFEIHYTSLQMSCSEQQIFTVTGGCPPYTWEIAAGGGELEYYGSMGIIYHAPTSNPNCTSNPTIECTDCCGNSQSVSLAVNCVSGGNALKYLGWEIVYCDKEVPTEYCAPYHTLTYGLGNIHIKRWTCGGELTYDCLQAVGFSGCSEDLPDCDLCIKYGPPCVCIDCWACEHAQDGPPYDTVRDMRTQAEKDAGCCPINPLTGLPF